MIKQFELFLINLKKYSIHNIFFIAAILFFLLIHGTTKAQNDEADIQQVKATFYDYIEAMMKPNAETIERILSDDHCFVGYTGVASTKEQIVGAFKSGVYKLAAFVPDMVNFRIYGNTAVMNGRATIKEQAGDSSWDTKVIVTQVWIKKNDNWYLVSEHVSKIDS